MNVIKTSWIRPIYTFNYMKKKSYLRWSVEDDAAVSQPEGESLRLRLAAAISVPVARWQQGEQAVTATGVLF